MTTYPRRTFLKNTTVSTAALSFSAALAKPSLAADSPNETIQIGVVGLHNRGTDHYRTYSRIPNVKVTAICDIDERLFPKAVEEIEKLYGETPKTYTDYREMLADASLDVISIAVPDHWHALMTIWACQAGKDVYVEKPLSFTIEEGRKMVQAARKYNRVVQMGTQHVSNPVTQEAFRQIREGALGDIYMGRAIIYGTRGDIGRVPDSAVPAGVHWDRFLGPAPARPFNENRFHYKWHWFWDTSTTEFGNNGVHYMDLVRRAMNHSVHPRRIHCTGNFYVHDSDQEIPNVQTATYEYDDGTLTEMEVRSWYTNPEAGQKAGAFLFGTKGWMYLAPGVFQIHLGPKDEPGPQLTTKDLPPLPESEKGIEPHFKNFIDCVRSRQWQNLRAEVLEGHRSTVISHLGNISYKTGRKLIFDPQTEQFEHDPEANALLTRPYREPYAIPAEV
ncbi:MAG: Gfo/Idh/MocA family oxidoreductase [bacterium]|jgi:predicted dehydrogenase|nr:Gfo/Idh/MocA family oxidoreductase [bacterium]